jgi:hypothetical protein
MMPDALQTLLPLGDVQPHRNRGLFADHYLNNPDRLHSLVEWRQATGIQDALRQIVQLYAQRIPHFTIRTNEDQTEHDFIQPVLDLLRGGG